MPDKILRMNGILFLTIGLLTFLEMVDVVGGTGRAMWPVLLVGAGLYGLVHGSSDTRFALPLFIGGLGEIVRLAGITPVSSGLIWPLALSIMGILMIKGKSVAPIYRRLGGALILTGAARTIGIVSGIHKGTVELGWIIPTLAAGLLWLQIPTLREEGT